MELSLKIKDYRKLEQTFKKAPGVASDEYKKALKQVAAFVVSEAQKNAPVGKYEGGGNLRQSIRQFNWGSTGFIVRVGAEYGVYVDQGTKPHVILPRRKPYLTFKARDGRWVRTKRVNHPGTKAQPFFTNAVEDAGPYADKQLSKVTDNILSKI